MNYHDIKHNDMLNGDGIRVTLFVSGCPHHCKGCHNSQTWRADSGIEFDDNAKNEIFEELSKDYISGITLSGGDPLYKHNLEDVNSLILEIKEKFPNKTIWLYTGYTYDYLYGEMYIWHSETCHIINSILDNVDVLVDGKYIEKLNDKNLKWVGSSNQNVIYLKNNT